MGRSNSKEQVVDFENSIQKSNSLSMAKLNKGLSLNQMQLFAFAIYSTQTDGKTEFNKADFERKFEIEKYQTVNAKRDAETVFDLKFSNVDLENDSFEFNNVFQSIKYSKGLFKFKWTEDMIPHILELQEHYITTDLSITAKFKSGFSWVLYDYLKSHYGYWHKNLSKDALMKLFSVEDKKTYQQNTARFKISVLDAAIEELNKYTELEVWYVEKKEGRSIVGFELHWSSGQKVAAASTSQMEALERVLNAIEKDMWIYIDLNNNDHRKEATELVRKSMEMQVGIKEGKITKERAKTYLADANAYIKRLEKLLELNNESTERKVKRVPFYNWLEERD
ncbi:replication initiation protein [Sporosarcina sp. BP05]|uniref:replication initiation protein n=1 Tax=Sporosarcina sp. BP05 TaxID=2758726 RepID=UPI001648E1A6|nr:replication initiation protein [Sporosarcina sp. BP05]